MNLKILTPALSVADQLASQDFQELRGLGYTTVINNRPDNESAAQPESELLRKMAEEHGLSYAHLPIHGLNIESSDVEKFVGVVNASAGPVLAFCRTGMRSTRLWALSRPANMSPQAILRVASDVGYDISALRPLLESE